MSCIASLDTPGPVAATPRKSGAPFGFSAALSSASELSCALGKTLLFRAPSGTQRRSWLLGNQPPAERLTDAWWSAVGVPELLHVELRQR